MTMMENLVRPWVADNVSPLPFPVGPAVPEDIVECSLGGSGGATITWSFSGTGEAPTFEDDMVLRETGRQSENVRVENPNDSSNFVEVCRTKVVSMQQEKPKSTKQSSFLNQQVGDPAAQTSTFNYTPPASANECPTKSLPPPRGCSE